MPVERDVDETLCQDDLNGFDALDALDRAPQPESSATSRYTARSNHRVKAAELRLWSVRDDRRDALRAARSSSDCEKAGGEDKI